MVNGGWRANLGLVRSAVVWDWESSSLGRFRRFRVDGSSDPSIPASIRHPSDLAIRLRAVSSALGLHSTTTTAADTADCDYQPQYVSSEYQSLARLHCHRSCTVDSVAIEYRHHPRPRAGLALPLPHATYTPSPRTRLSNCIGAVSARPSTEHRGTACSRCRRAQRCAASAVVLETHPGHVGRLGLGPLSCCTLHSTLQDSTPSTCQ